MNQNIALVLARKALDLVGKITTSSVAITNQLTSTSNSPSAIYIHANGGTNESVKIYSEQGDTRYSIDIQSSLGGIGLTTGHNGEKAITLETDGGEAQTIYIHSGSGTSTTDKNASIQMKSDVGGINLYSGALSNQSIYLHENGNPSMSNSSQIKIYSQQSRSTEAIRIDSQRGGVVINGGINAYGGQCIYIHANGGTQETIKIHSDLGTSNKSINIVSDLGNVTVMAHGPQLGSGFEPAVGRWIPRDVRGESVANNTVTTWEFLIDFTGLKCGAAETIIGNDEGTSCYFGQYTTNLFGTLFGGKILCLEELEGGDADVGIYCADESTGSQNTDPTTLTNAKELLDYGTWNIGDVACLDLSNPPNSGQYLYFVGNLGNNSVYTAGKFILTFYGI